MFPGGMNPRQMKQMMKRMGIKTEDIDAEVVVIHGSGEEIIIEEPQVVKMLVQGQEIFQITGGRVRKQETKAEIDIEDEDVRMVAEQANVSIKEARETLEEAGGDIAAAIMKLKS